ncbi:hypothetical protein NQ318_017313 [Aromia moschata]|uniref:Exonuclease domain-containing protein n=1 Tax=Aromia moschata TaxID=1265417 RepID=A0AAV8XXQ9_9CUCU|nr:hypothetical protein NQ318_017313 [Aromia moschata]
MKGNHPVDLALVLFDCHECNSASVQEHRLLTKMASSGNGTRRRMPSRPPYRPPPIIHIDPETEYVSFEGRGNSKMLLEYYNERSRELSVERSTKAKNTSRKQNNYERDNSASFDREALSARFASMDLREIREAKAMVEEREKALAPLRAQWNSLDMCEFEFGQWIFRYVLSEEEKTQLGYPIASDTDDVNVTIYRDPYAYPEPQIVCGSPDDSGRESYSDSSDSGSGDFHRGSRNLQKRKCSRCARPFLTDDDGYVTKEGCCYHWGRAYPARPLSEQLEHICCKSKAGTRGCTYGNVHVWDGLESGHNGPIRGFVRTLPSSNLHRHRVLALDCETCYTVRGLELTKVSVVGVDGSLVYDSLVRPSRDIVDYNTRFSGITAEDLNGRRNTKTLHEVQDDLLDLIADDALIIGHGLENDLRALKIVHGYVIDTTMVFPHVKGLPFKRSLRSLASSVLHREIQRGTGAEGHDSYEDAIACMELMVWRVSMDRQLGKNPRRLCRNSL